MLDLTKMPKRLTLVTIILLALLFFFLWTQFIIAKTEEKILCSSFSTQSEAQKAYDWNPIKYARLDGYDQDKKVCESLPRFQ